MKIQLILWSMWISVAFYYVPLIDRDGNRLIVNRWSKIFDTLTNPRYCYCLDVDDANNDVDYLWQIPFHNLLHRMALAVDK